MRHALATIAITIALTTPSIAAPIYPSAENPRATARTMKDSTNCRKAPSLLATVNHEIPQNTPVSLDIRTAVPGVTIGRGGTQWVFEYSRSCWVHESGIFWMQDRDPRLNEVLSIVDR